MRHFFIGIFSILFFVSSCIKPETEEISYIQDGVEFYASFEQPSTDTRVYATEDLHLRWHADDRVSIFNKLTYNQQYKFIGATGDNGGGFNRVDNAEFVTGNSISNVVSVYPYKESTKISEDGILTIDLPSEQQYGENSFGIGANTMVSVSTDNILQFKNVGGYLVISMYGDGISLSSVLLKGNNGERIAGKALVTMPVDGIPSVEMTSNATTEVTITSSRPVLLGSKEENCTKFWFVIPPTTFRKGITVVVTRKDGTAFTKTTSNPITINRNTLSKMSPFEVQMEGTQPNNIIYYTSSDGKIVEPYIQNVFGAAIVSNNYLNGVGILTFNNPVTSIGKNAFKNCSRLTSVSIPESVTSIGNFAFSECSSLLSIEIPGKVTEIGAAAFSNCQALTSVILQDGITSIGGSAFSGCSNLTNITLPRTVSSIGDYAFSSCVSLNSIIIPEGVTDILYNTFSWCSGLTSITIPESVKSIGNDAFNACSSLASIVIPRNVLSIGRYAFQNCSGLVTASIPKSTSIGNYAFQNCSSLQSIRIQDGISGIEASIGYYSFENCRSLTTVTIPDCVTSIGEYAFNYCPSLTRIDVLPPTPPMGGPGMFSNTNLCPIYIPAGSEEDYVNAEYWKQYALRMRVEGQNGPIAYSSSDYSSDGDVLLLQAATEGRGINIILMGDGFLDRDMGAGGKYEMRMREAMEQFFAYEPFYSFRNRFNIYTVKVVSKNDIYGDEASDRRFTYDNKNGAVVFRLEVGNEYAELVPNQYNQPIKYAVICNVDHAVGRSVTYPYISSGKAACVIHNIISPILNHELGGHAFGQLWDEYVEKSGTFTATETLDKDFYDHGWGANIDWRSSPNEVRWAHLLRDPRYSHEGLGVIEGGYLYPHGVYRPTENSMMRYNDCPFNAPSREQIYKFIMKYSEGDAWQYNYEEFVKADERGRMEAAEGLGVLRASPSRVSSKDWKDYHCPPVMVDDNVKEIGIDKEGEIIKVY